MRIGIVDLDTSHPANWIPIERELGHDVAGLWDGGSVHPPEYVRRFATEHAIPRVYETLEQMAGDVDCAVIHGCDWDTHVAKARPFVEAGKAVLVDKPLAGNVRDLRQFCRWAGAGARIAGGSSLRFCIETQQFLQRPLAERGAAHTVLCGCAVDDFNYGIHAYAHLSGILGPGAVSVQHLGAGGQRRVRVDWADGRMGLLIIGAAAEWLPFYTTIVTPQDVTQLIVSVGGIYRALLESVLPFLSGATDRPPVSMADLIEPELCALAAQVSWRNGDRPVRLTDLRDEAGYDGRAFALGYRTQKYPQSKG